MKYRPDIDGLRAIAVMAVIAFHGKTSVAPGGFVGVDIFLVISGYLITSRIRQGIQSRTFTLSGFYARRARRIFPALFTMLAILWALGLLWLLPGERYELAKETIASVFSVANLLFYSETGYFEPAALTIPLLHIWSLGVEEQFYLLLPLLIMFTKASWLPATFGGLIIASFAIYLPAARDYPDAAFYLLPMRIWEFLIGGIVAYRNFPAPRGVSDAGMGGAGLMLIALAIFIPPALMPFAGAPVLAAATGAALIIASGSVAQNSVSRLLSIPPLNLVGRVSYSLYLWHWPVIVVLRRSLFEAHPIHPAAELTVVFAISMAIAWASWRFVEIPFRSSIRPRAATIAASAAGLAISSICGADMLAAKFSHTDPANLAALTRYGEKYDNSQYFRSSSCFIFSKSTTKLNKDKCLSKSATKKNYLIVGDSHAAHLWYGLSTVYSDFNWMQATASGCLPDPKPVGAERCTKVMNFVFNEYLVHNPVDLLVVAARWEGRLDEVSRIIEWAKSHGVPLLIVGPTIEYDAELPTLVIDSARLGNSSLIAAHLRPNQRERDAEMQTFVTNKGVPYVSMQSLLCDSKDCRSRVDGGIPMQFDYGHLTAEGSIYVATEMKAKNLLP